MFHDEKNLTSVGDEVVIVPCRPMSGKKTFILDQVVKKHNNEA